MIRNNNVDPRMIHLLEKLKPVAPRDPHAAARGRARFLSEAVSAAEKQRHSLWNIFPQKERLAMKLIVSMLVIVVMLFGGNATVAAAQDDLPNQSLYGLKLMNEDIRLWFVSDPLQQIDMLMQQVQTRLQEMETLASRGITPPTELTLRVQERIQRALQIAAKLDGESQLAALHQIQVCLQRQEHLMNQFQHSNCRDCEPVLDQTREMLQLRLREMEGDLATPQPMQNQQQSQTQNQTRMIGTPQPTDTAMPSCTTCTPMMDGMGQQNGGNIPAGTPMQQNYQTNQNQQTGGGMQGGGGMGPGDGNNSSPGGGGRGGKP